MRENNNLVRISAANCDVNDFAIATLCLAIEKNTSLKSINLESNRIGPDTLASLFEALSNNVNSVVEIHVSNQAQSHMGYRVESRIAKAIAENRQLMKVGLRFEFTEVMDRVLAHLISNIDNRRKERVKTSGVSEKTEWKPARVLDEQPSEDEE